MLWVNKYPLLTNNHTNVIQRQLDATVGQPPRLTEHIISYCNLSSVLFECWWLLM